jgi:hypothetical protein
MTEQLGVVMSDIKEIIMDGAECDSDLLKMSFTTLLKLLETEIVEIENNNINRVLSQNEMDALIMPNLSFYIEALEDRDIQKVLCEGRYLLSGALLMTDDKTRDKIFNNMSKRSLAMLMEDMEDRECFGYVGKRSVYEAQGEIISMICHLKNCGAIVISGKNRNSMKNNQCSFNNIEEFKTFLVEHRQIKEPLGSFSEGTAMCRFFDSQNGETILADIENKNEAQGMGNFLIPETNIKLINYSVCPHCGRMFSFKDLMDYYANPRIDIRFANRAHQYREDTRVCCNECDAYFLPALVICDGTPKNEVQFLCKVQTVNAIEVFYRNNGIFVLTTERKNIMEREAGGKTIKAIKNDVLLKDMSSSPTLINNLLQYTPANLIPNLINGTNYYQDDVLFGMRQ